MNIFGETQDDEKFVPLVTRAVRQGEEVQIHVDTEGVPGSRSYLHARNQASAVLFALNYASENLVSPARREGLRHNSGESDAPFRFHISGQRQIDNLEMAKMIARIVGRPLRYTEAAAPATRPGHDLRYALDDAWLRSLGWMPPVPLEEALQRTVEWFQRHPEWLSSSAPERQQ